MGGAKAILATVTNSEAMQGIAGGLGANGVMMVIGVGGPLTRDPVDPIRNSAGVRCCYTEIARDAEDTLDFSRRNKAAPINEIYQLDRAQEDYERMLSG